MVRGVHVADRDRRARAGPVEVEQHHPAIGPDRPGPDGVEHLPPPMQHVQPGEQVVALREPHRLHRTRASGRQGVVARLRPAKVGVEPADPPVEEGPVRLVPDGGRDTVAVADPVRVLGDDPPLRGRGERGPPAGAVRGGSVGWCGDADREAGGVGGHPGFRDPGHPGQQHGETRVERRRRAQRLLDAFPTSACTTAVSPVTGVIGSTARRPSAAIVNPLLSAKAWASARPACPPPTASEAGRARPARR